MKTKHQSITSVEEITPEIAEKYLSANTHNRSLKEKIVQRYAAMIKSGQWDLNGESIKFDINGVLLDGQHRLWAVIEAQKSITTYVLRGLAPEVMETIDTGARRSAGDLLQIDGIANGTSIAAASRLVYSYYQGLWGTYETRLDSTTSNRTVVETVNKYPGIIESIGFMKSNEGHIRPFTTASLAGALHYILSRINEEKANAFFESFITGASLDAEHPVLSLRTALQRIKGQGREERMVRVALIIKAWNLFIKDKKSRVLSWRTYEGFPQILSPRS